MKLAAILTTSFAENMTDSEQYKYLHSRRAIKALHAGLRLKECTKVGLITRYSVSKEGISHLITFQKRSFIQKTINREELLHTLSYH